MIVKNSYLLQSKGWVNSCLLLLILFLVSCQLPTNSSTKSVELPAHFPSLPIPEDNPVNEQTVTFGKRLFFDKALSLDSSIACVSCHHPQFAFSDTVAFSLGVRDSIGKRNSPSLMNVAYQKRLFRDGGQGSLEKQVITPVVAPHEMAFDLKKLASRLAEDVNYQALSQAAYQRPISPYTIVRGLAAYQRTLISSNSPYDQFVYQQDSAALSSLQQAGMQLFFSERTQCATCHSGVLFTNQAYESNGLYENYPDIGRAGVSLNKQDKGKFKVPSLRNVALTAPYMFDGSLPTLEAVIEHYHSGGRTHINKSALVQPLYLSDKEKTALVAFLESLTDAKFKVK